MKTLVIHPDDRSTDFLKPIYEGKGWTVLNFWKNQKEVINAIKKHDRIVMMGHGSPMGLFNISYMGYVIDSKLVYLLKERQNVAIWCNADIFMKRYELRGFFTGMFISEVHEASIYGITATQDEIDYSNDLFSTHMREVIDSPKVLDEIKIRYIGESPVIQFNNDRLFYRNGNVKSKDSGEQLLLIT